MRMAGFITRYLLKSGSTIFVPFGFKRPDPPLSNRRVGLAGGYHTRLLGPKFNIVTALRAQSPAQRLHIVGYERNDRQFDRLLSRQQAGLSVAESLAAALGNAAGKKTGYRCLGTGNTANWSRMARRVGDAQDGATCRAPSVGGETQRAFRGCSVSARSAGG
jgi:hypothetical protein